MFELNSELAWAYILLIYCGEFALYVASFFPPYYHSTVTGNKETQYKDTRCKDRNPMQKNPYRIIQYKKASRAMSHYFEPRFTLCNGKSPTGRRHHQLASPSR
jgi:hypothetical protein